MRSPGRAERPRSLNRMPSWDFSALSFIKDLLRNLWASAWRIYQYFTVLSCSEEITATPNKMIWRTFKVSTPWASLRIGTAIFHRTFKHVVLGLDTLSFIEETHRRKVLVTRAPSQGFNALSFIEGGLPPSPPSRPASLRILTS